jgi:PTH1 family peptidyl-tRNA hydrolase
LENFISETADVEVKNKIKFYFSPTYMNLSGNLIPKILKERKVLSTQKKDDFSDIFVFCDDVNISVGDFKISFEVGASSHNGIKSIVEKLGSKKFWRVRVGVGKKQILGNGKVLNWRPEATEMSDYVLGKFIIDEVDLVKSLSQKVLVEIFKIINL